MPSYVYVEESLGKFIDEAIAFVKRNEGPLVAVTANQVIDYLKNKNVAHATTNDKNKIPAGSYYHGN
jgi:hypothetical protein